MSTFRRLVLAIIGLALAIPVSMPPADAQSSASMEMPHAPKSIAAAKMRLPANVGSATSVLLAPVDPGQIEAAKAVNATSWNKRLQIGIGRPIEAMPEASSGALRWTTLATGSGARWEVTSPGAQALRIGLLASRVPTGVEIRFAASAQPDTVYGPYAAQDLIAGDETYWSPVLEGDRAIVEVWVPSGESPDNLALAITQVSHLFVSPSDPRAEKAAGVCEVDLVCRSATDPALAAVGRAVARMTFSDSAGSYLCTGTLLSNTGGSLTPYFYSAAHCMSTQAVASTLATHWFYDRSGCGVGTTSPSYVQTTGGATLLYANTPSDVLLLRLNSSPPSGAVFAGWDASTVPVGTALTAVHHPAGDWKKVSLGMMTRFGAPSGSGTNYLVSQWNSVATGVTEGGSSGSGIFTAVGQPASEYKLRGGLQGGPSSCTEVTSNLYDYYSRFDQAYAFIAQYLNPLTPSCSYTLSQTSATVGGGATSGSVNVTTSPGCTWSVAGGSSWLTSSSSGSGSGTATYSVAANAGGASRVGTLTIAGIPFTVTQQASGGTSTNLLADPGFESGSASWAQSTTSGFAIIYQDPSIAHSGSRYAWLGGYDSGTDVLYQQVTIPAGQAALQFWYRITTAETTPSTAYDTLTVSIANAVTGARLATLATYSNLSRTSGWVQSPAFDVSSFAGQTVRLVFTATMDVSNVTNFFVDDILLTATGTASPNYTALWWNALESGWGINFTHQGDTIFATWFTYDPTGKAWWLSMTANKIAENTYTGALIQTSGPAFSAVPFDPTRVTRTSVGSGTLTFSDANNASFAYTVNGLPQTKSITKQIFGPLPTCVYSAQPSFAAATNYQGLWWVAAGAESGWGINLTHQGDNIFATWFTYDIDGTPMWLSVTAARTAQGIYNGQLIRTTGPAFSAMPFNPGAVTRSVVGGATFMFADGSAATFAYTVNGVAQAKVITRQLFVPPAGTLCQ